MKTSYSLLSGNNLVNLITNYKKWFSEHPNEDRMSLLRIFGNEDNGANRLIEIAVEYDVYTKDEETHAISNTENDTRHYYISVRENPDDDEDFNEGDNSPYWVLEFENYPDLYEGLAATALTRAIFEAFELLYEGGGL